MTPRFQLILRIQLAVVGLFLAPLLSSQTETAPDEVGQESARFAQIYGVVERNHADPVDADNMIFEGAIRAMLARLDPFSAFFNREQFELLEQQTRGEALGFGTILYVQPGKVIVLQAAEGSPSWRVGLGPGDEIVELNGTRLDRLDFQSLVELLQRSRSQPVRLGVIHPGKVIAQNFDLKPAEVALPTVDKAFALSPGIGYVHISGFEQKTSQELVDAIARVGGTNPGGLKSLLLDLRDNHGGMLDAALVVASLFLKQDVLVLTVHGRSVPEKTYRTLPTTPKYDWPLIILVNGNTASAAEVLAAALQEHDRGVIVGEPTFGKGLVESVFNLSEKTGLALTTAQYFTPSGRSIQRPMPGTALATMGTVGTRHGVSLPGPAVDAVRQQQDGMSAQGFHTDDGRPVLQGGGITPDVLIHPRELDPWAAFLNERGIFPSYGSEYLTLHGKVGPDFEPDSKVLENFRDFLTRRQIRSPDEYWKQDQGYLKIRIKTELFNLVFGLARGDEAEVRGDPQVQKAVALFPRIAYLLRPPAGK